MARRCRFINLLLSLTLLRSARQWRLAQPTGLRRGDLDAASLALKK